MDRVEYVQNMENEVLADKLSYLELHEDPTESFHNRTYAFFKSLWSSKLLLKKEMEAIAPSQEPQLPYMFGLIKLHKANCPLRPVVSCGNSILAPSALLIDAILKPIVADDPRFLKDTYSCHLKR